MVKAAFETVRKPRPIKHVYWELYFYLAQVRDRLSKFNPDIVKVDLSPEKYKKDMDDNLQFFVEFPSLAPVIGYSYGDEETMQGRLCDVFSSGFNEHGLCVNLERTDITDNTFMPLDNAGQPVSPEQELAFVKKHVEDFIQRNFDHILKMAVETKQVLDIQQGTRKNRLPSRDQNLK